MANFDNIIQEINTNLPDNSTQAITAAKLRTTLIDLTNQIDTVQDDFETEVNNSIDDLENNLENNIESDFKDITKNYNAIAVLSGTVSNYSWWTIDNTPVSVNIPSGCVVKNVGDVRVNLYEQEDTSGVHILSNVGSLITTTSTYTRIRGTGDEHSGNFKLFIYADTDIPNLVPTVNNLSTTVSGYDNTINSLETNAYLSGTKYISTNVSAYANYTLPFTIPAGTHIIVGLEGDNSLKTLYFNYGASNQKNINDFGCLDFSPNFEISKIRCSKAGTLFVKFVNDDFITEINDNSITPSKIEGEHIKSPNLFNKETATDGYYINQNTGYPSTSNTLCYSDYIPVIPETNYYTYPTTSQKAFYDAGKNYISGASAGSSITTPANAKFMRVSVTMSNKDIEIINQGTTTIPYVPYYDKVRNFNIISGIDEQSFNDLNTVKTITSRLWNGYVSTTENSLSNGSTITLTDYPKALKKGDKISFSANITSWGDGITIGKGTTDYSAAYAVIDSTNIVLKSYASGTETTHGTVAHGLNFETYIKVIIDIEATKWKFIVQTLTDTFTTEINCSYSNGSPRITSNGATLTDITLSCTNENFAKPIWMFGDSYFGIASQIRELYWLNEWGYLNTLVQGYAGQGSSSAYADLQRCIAISKPKYIVWCLGMNDNGAVSIWQSYIANIKEICNTYGITLILATVPTPLNTTSYLHKDEISNWIRTSSECRYIDVAKAVGSNAQGQWYGYGETYDYQSTDNVHPSVYGAKAIATQFLIDFPEIMQY